MQSPAAASERHPGDFFHAPIADMARRSSLVRRPERIKVFRHWRDETISSILNGWTTLFKSSIREENGFIIDKKRRSFGDHG
jgi:hypothetical protein